MLDGSAHPGVERRPTFDEAEWKEVYSYLRDWVKETTVTAASKEVGRLHRSGPNAMRRYQRELLQDYRLLLTGFFDLHFHEQLPVGGDAEAIGKFIAARMRFNSHQLLYEEALLTAI